MKKNEKPIKTIKTSYMPSMPYDEKPYEMDRNDLEDEMMYAEAEILLKRRLVRLMDISLTEWLELKYGALELAPKVI